MYNTCENSLQCSLISEGKRKRPRISYAIIKSFILLLFFKIYLEKVVQIHRAEKALTFYVQKLDLCHHRINFCNTILYWIYDNAHHFLWEKEKTVMSFNSFFFFLLKSVLVAFNYAIHFCLSWTYCFVFTKKCKRKTEKKQQQKLNNKDCSEPGVKTHSLDETKRETISME